jgi:general secretion pathway protein M
MAIRLNKREKYAVVAMVGFVGIFIVMQFIVFPVIDKRDQLRRSVTAKTRTLADMMSLKAEHDDLKKQIVSARARYSKREKGFTLFSFLDRLAGQAGIKDQITYMKPSTVTQKGTKLKISVVEMKIQGVTLNRLVPYLFMVETSENSVYIRRLSISKPDKGDGVINAVLQVEAAEA